jgi:hypothetical protein
MFFPLNYTSRIETRTYGVAYKQGLVLPLKVLSMFLHFPKYIDGDPIDGPALIILALVTANIRNCCLPSSKVRALDVFLSLSSHLTDEAKLDRMVPYIVDLLNDDSAMVRSAALRTLMQVVCFFPSPLSSHVKLLIVCIAHVSGRDHTLERHNFSGIYNTQHQTSRPGFGGLCTVYVCPVYRPARRYCCKILGNGPSVEGAWDAQAFT